MENLKSRESKSRQFCDFQFSISQAKTRRIRNFGKRVIATAVLSLRVSDFRMFYRKFEDRNRVDPLSLEYSSLHR